MPDANDESEWQKYIDDCEPYASLMIAARQWDYVNHTAVRQWIGNFGPSKFGTYCAWRILRNLIYYSARDIEALLREGLFHNILGHDIRIKHQIASEFSRYPSHLKYYLERSKEKTLLVPIMSNNNPSESAPEVSRIIVQKLRFPEGNVVFPKDLTDAMLSSYDRIILIDDNIGSGDQFDEFWNEFECSDRYLVSQRLTGCGKPIYCLVVVATEAGIDKLESSYSEIKFLATQKLGTKYQVFSQNSIFWANDAEREKAKDLFSNVLRSFGIPLLGHKDLDYAVILHDTIPDWSLPMLWKSSVEWNLLMESKNSHG